MDAVEEVKARLNIEDVIGEYVQLKRAGRNWRGLSPFTSERTPSFIVSPEKQIWHDFSSGKGGNIFSFVMEMEGLDFKGALEVLARKAGVDLEQYRQASNRTSFDKERLYAALEMSAKFYQVHFSKNRTVLEYVLKTRQFSKDTALSWRIGYSPPTGNSLTDFLRSKGFREEELRAAGLVTRRYERLVDMFRDRLMIPLADSQGRIIGFTARILTNDKNAPKYINTPQTVLYDKSRHVYGLHFAKEAIRRNGFVVVSEGNLDVIASHQVGVKQVVATAGTALTEQHLKALSRLAADIRLCFDADKAGLAATERAIPIASKVGVTLSIINLPKGKDPDELIRSDPKLWQITITQYRYALDWLMDRYGTLLDLTTAVGKRQYSDILLPIVRRLQDPVEQDHYLAAIAAASAISRDALQAKLLMPKFESGVKTKSSSPNASPVDFKQVEFMKAQDHLLAVVLFNPALHEYLELITPAMLAKEESKQLLLFLRSNPDFNGKTAEHEVLKSVADYVMILGLQYEELYQDLELTELQYEAARLTARLIESFVKSQKQMLAQELAGANEAQTAQLLETVKQLDRLLNRVKGG